MSFDRNRPRPKRWRAAPAVWLLCPILLGGCAPPLLEYNLNTPAAMVTPIAASGVSDGRSRFREIFCALLGGSSTPSAESTECGDHLLRLADEPSATPHPRPLPQHRPGLRLLLVPGAFSECFGSAAEPFREGVGRLRELGYTVHTLKSSGRSSSEYVAEQIAEAMAPLLSDPGEGVVLIGYSKGINDILEFLVAYPELAAEVTAVISIAGSVNGSPLADRYAGLYASWLADIDLAACGPGDGGVLESIRRTKALTWLATHRLPQHIRYFSLGSFTGRDLIARAMSLTVYGSLTRVDPRNDGQTVYYDQLIPGSTLLGYANADHWSVAIPLRETMPFLAGNGSSNGEYPRSALLEAMMLFVVERLASEAQATTPRRS